MTDFYAADEEVVQLLAGSVMQDFFRFTAANLCLCPAIYPDKTPQLFPTDTSGRQELFKFDSMHISMQFNAGFISSIVSG